MSAKRNLVLFTPYLVCSQEGVCHGIYLVWLTVHKGLSPLAVAGAMAAGDLALIVLEVPTGLFADRLGARRSLILGSIVQIAGLVLFWRASSVTAVAVAALAIAVGDAFRRGADEALLYRSTAAAGEVESFGPRIARAQAAELIALVGLTALGGFVASKIGYDAAWAMEIGLATVGLGLALAMTEPASAASAVDEEDEETPILQTLFTHISGRVPWSIIAPVTVVGALSSTAEMLAQTTQPDDRQTTLVALVIAGGIAVEAAGALLVARGLIPIRAATLDALAWTSMLGLALVAISPHALIPGAVLVFLGRGAAPAIRSALVQHRARDGERATVASLASAADMLGHTAALPLAAWLFARLHLSGAAAALFAIAALAWALARRRRGRERG